MSGPRIGSLCSGYGGLDLGVEAVIGGRTVWVSDIDKGACKVLAHRFPDAPNLGDMTAVDWANVPPVDVLTGGTPCQDLSHAGRRAGMTEGTRSNLWVMMREAIAHLRPALVVWENVGGAYSAAADSDVEPCAGCVGDGSGVHLRALGRVLGDLASLGYDAGWCGLRAADVGAPHGRLRVFVVAWPAASVASDFGHEWSGASRDGWAGPADGDRGAVTLLGTPRASEWKGSGPVGSKSHAHMEARDYLSAQVLSLLPTPAVNDMSEGKTVEAWDAWTDRMKAKHGNGNGHGASLAIEAQRLLPTPRVSQAGYADDGRGGKSLDVEARSAATWGDYAAAIQRWEHLTRSAPAPTETGPKGSPRLSPAFTEWMMGVPAGWITDVPGVTRNEALKLCGNGVVPQQAAEAVATVLAWRAAVAQKAAA